MLAAGKIATALAMTEAVLFHFLEENIIAALCTAGNVLHCGAPRKCQLCAHMRALPLRYIVASKFHFNFSTRVHENLQFNTDGHLVQFHYTKSGEIHCHGVWLGRLSILISISWKG